MSEEKQAFEGGATRTVQAERYDLIPVAAVRALARRLALGAKKHGERNWEKGGAEFEKATLSHGIAHLLQYAQTGQQDDLDGAICNLAFLCHFSEKAAAERERVAPAGAGGILSGWAGHFGGGRVTTYMVGEQPSGAVRPPLRRPMPARRLDRVDVTEVPVGSVD